MKVMRIIATLLVSVSMAFFLACSEQKTASLEGNEDIAAVFQKLSKCLDNPEPTKDIYIENAVLKWQDGETGAMRESTGSKEIEKYYKERGENYRWIKLVINDIKKDANNAHVEYQLTTQDRRATLEYQLNCSAKMVKQGQAWKIKEAITKFDHY